MHLIVHCSTIYNSQNMEQPRCPSTDEQIKKFWYIYTMEYYSAIKRNAFESVLMRWMNLEPIIQSEVSQKSVLVTLCDPMDCSPPGSSIHGILQTRILECVAIPFSKVRKKDKYRILMHVQRIQKDGTKEFICRVAREKHREQTCGHRERGYTSVWRVTQKLK